ARHATLPGGPTSDHHGFDLPAGRSSLGAGEGSHRTRARQGACSHEQLISGILVMTHNEQVVLVTGAGSGIGRAIALSLARAGHRLYASMRDVCRKNSERADALLQLAREEELSLDVLELDVLSEVGCQAAVNHILADNGRLDVVVNNA